MDDTVEEASAERPGGFGSLGSILHLLVLAWAAVLASFPLNDNSFFTHLATGRLILDEGRVPTTDPYTFTAHGEPWTVQSWLASVAYAGAERLGGDVGLRVLVLAVFLVAASLLWRLTRPASSVVVRLLLAAGALVVATGLWSARPYLIGVIGLALLWLALDGSLRPWLLVPFLWIWVNTHGSWPLALALVGAVLLGDAMDRRGKGGALVGERERRVALAVVLGALLGAVGPLGPRILWFPLKALTQSGSFAEIVEWRSPTYQSTAELAFLVLALVAVLALVRRGSWRSTIPAVVFLAAGLYAQRNVVMATVVLVAACARSAPRIGTLRGGERPPLGLPLAGLAGILVVVLGALAVATPAVDDEQLDGYPGRGLAWLEQADLDGRLAAPDYTGNLLEVLDGAEGDVFVDDRADMFPPEVFEDAVALRNGEPGWQQILDRHDIDVVVWPSEQPLSALLAADRGWRLAYSDVDWLVATRRR